MPGKRPTPVPGTFKVPETLQTPYMIVGRLNVSFCRAGEKFGVIIGAFLVLLALIYIRNLFGLLFMVGFGMQSLSMVIWVLLALAAFVRFFREVYEKLQGLSLQGIKELKSMIQHYAVELASEAGVSKLGFDSQRRALTLPGMWSILLNNAVFKHVEDRPC